MVRFPLSLVCIPVPIYRPYFNKSVNIYWIMPIQQCLWACAWDLLNMVRLADVSCCTRTEHQVRAWDPTPIFPLPYQVFWLWKAATGLCFTLQCLQSLTAGQSGCITPLNQNRTPDNSCQVLCDFTANGISYLWCVRPQVLQIWKPVPVRKGLMALPQSIRLHYEEYGWGKTVCGIFNFSLMDFLPSPWRFLE